MRAALLELRSSAEVAFDGSWRAVDAFVAGATQSPLVEEVRVRVTCAGWRLERHRPSGITLRGGRDGGTWSHLGAAMSENEHCHADRPLAWGLWRLTSITPVE